MQMTDAEIWLAESLIAILYSISDWSDARKFVLKLPDSAKLGDELGLEWTPSHLSLPLLNFPTSLRPKGACVHTSAHVHSPTHAYMCACVFTSVQSFEPSSEHQGLKRCLHSNYSVHVRAGRDARATRTFRILQAYIVITITNRIGDPS